MTDKRDLLNKRHVILSPKEVGRALCDHILREQGVDPDKHTTRFTAVYRIIEGQIVASIAIDECAVTAPTHVGRASGVTGADPEPDE